MTRPTQTGLIASSRAHLAGVGEDYFQHMRFAATVGLALVIAGAACLVHALVPALFQTTASTAIRNLHRLIENREDAQENLPSHARAKGFFLLTLLACHSALTPWLIGAPWMVALPLSILSLSFPIVFLLTPEEVPPQPATA